MMPLLNYETNNRFFKKVRSNKPYLLRRHSYPIKEQREIGSKYKQDPFSFTDAWVHYKLKKIYDRYCSSDFVSMIRNRILNMLFNCQKA